jgi:hypothetical protein
VRVRRRAWLFVATLTIGGIVVFTFASIFLNVDRAFDAAALYVAIATAAYTIVAEAAEKKRPLLRVTPRVVSGLGIGSLGLEIELCNIGEAVATDIRVECSLRGQQQVPLERGGNFEVASMAAGERKTIRVVGSVETQRLQSQESYIVKVRYKDAEGDEMKPIEDSGTIGALIEEFDREMLFRRR